MPTPTDWIEVGSIATGAGALVTAILAGVTWRVASKTKVVADGTKTLAEQTQRLAAATEEDVAASWRPVLLVRGNLSVHPGELGGRAEVKTAVRNAGKGPAMNRAHSSARRTPVAVPPTGTR